MTTTRNLLWTQNPDKIAKSQMMAFLAGLNDRYGLSLKSYNDLHKFSTENLCKFWGFCWDFFGIISKTPYDQVVDETLPIYEIPKWFRGSLLNYAENSLKKKGNGIAIISECENPDRVRSLTWDQLRLQVGQCSAALRAAGVQKGDRVAALVPNTIETVVFMLATSTIGAIWSSASTDFGLVGVLDRFRQIEPKILLSVEAVVYNQKVHNNLDKLEAVVKGLPTLVKVVVFPHVADAVDCSNILNGLLIDDFLKDFPLQEPTYEHMPFEHPLAVLFSSGTTGIPKCIVHSQGGILIQHLKEHRLHGNMDDNDIFFYYSTTGWMMFNWLIGGLSCGSTIVLYEGNPVAPSIDRLWKLVERHQITVFGTSAKYLQNLEEKGYQPKLDCNVSSLRTLYSTGSALKPSSFDFIYNNIKADIMVGSITGGTDICSLFAGHNYILPVYRGEIQCITLGMAVEAWDDSGKPLMDKPGDLVCRKPFPIMPVAFWNDKDGKKYQNAYFTQVRGVWYHGDFLDISSKTGGVMMLGRSDGTLNPAGVRFGSAELYNILSSGFPEVADSLAVGQNTPDGERVILFLKMASGHKFNVELVANIKTKIRTLLSARHVPAVIYPIGDIPYTLTGKKVEVAVKKIISGENVTPSSSLANPESLELFVKARSKL